MNLSVRVTLTAGLLALSSGLQAAESSRVWVVFNPGQKEAVRTQIQAGRGQLHYEFDRLQAFSATLPEAALAGLRNNPNVALVEPDPPRYLLGQKVPYGVDMVQARAVWDNNEDGVIDAGSPTGTGITVGVIDSGVYAAHEDFQGLDLSGYDGTGSAGWFTDFDSHGTHVVGTIAAANNSSGVLGVTPGTVKIYMVKVFGDNGTWAYSSSLVNAAYRCQQAGAKVISMSLGGGQKSRTEDRAFRDLHNNFGVLSIAAAGNDGNGASSYPASYSSVISVAAVDQNKVVADFSQQNSEVELAAPGVGVLSTVSYTGQAVTVDGQTYLAEAMEGSSAGQVSKALVNGGLGDTVGQWTDKVVLVERGGASFEEKVRNVVAGGGVAAVIYNNVAGGFAGTLGTYASPIPALSISQEDGQALLTKMGLNAAVDARASTTGSGYAYYDGTSMATPHVAAVAALVWSCDPSRSNDEIRTALQTSAEDLGALGRDNAYGYGLVQAAQALVYLGCTAAPNPGPSVTITSPADGETFASGTTVAVTATATDYQGADLSSSVDWYVDGSLYNTGSSINVAGLADGSHTITAIAIDENGEGSDSIGIYVGEPPPPPPTTSMSVFVTTDNTTYSNRDTVRITVETTGDGSPVAGASVSVAIAAPFSTLSANVTTGADGKALVTHKVNANRDGRGTYTVNATATASGYDPASGSTTFEVQ